MDSENSEKISLSICIIVKNEEKNLSKLFESIRDIASEIIVIDTGSTDNTKNICRGVCKGGFQTLSYAPVIKLYDFLWNDSFAEARNESLKYATQKWILVMDADMEFLSESKNELLKCLSDEKVTHYTVQCIEEEDKLIHPLCFLFRNGLGIEFTGYIHEYPEFDEKIHTLVNSEIYIKHLGYYKKNWDKSKRERNHFLLEKTIQDKTLGDEERLRAETYLLIDKISSSGSEILPEIYKLIHKIKHTEIKHHYPTFEAFFSISLNFLSNNIKLPTEVLNISKEGLSLFPFSVSLLYLFSKGLINVRYDFFNSLKIFHLIHYLVKNKYPPSYHSAIRDKELWNMCFIDYCMAVISYEYGFYDASLYYLNRIEEPESLGKYKESYLKIKDFSTQKTDILFSLKRDAEISGNAFTHYRLGKELLRLKDNPSEITGQYNRALAFARKENNINIRQIVISDLIMNSNSLGLSNEFISKLTEEAKIICSDSFYYSYAMSLYNSSSGNEGKSFILMKLAQKFFSESKMLIEPYSPELRETFYGLLFEANKESYFNKIISDELLKFS